jgi:antitoxin YefM
MGMKPLRVSEDVVPIAEFKGQAARWLKRAQETGQPVLITLNGKPAGVLVSPAEYDRLEDRERLFRDIDEGVRDLDNGRMMALDEARSLLARRRTRRRAR